jgi:DNA polymerase-3 subunit beta
VRAVVERGALLPALERCAKVANSKSTLSILGAVRLRAEGKMILVSATNLNESLVVRVPAMISAPGDWCVDAKGILSRVKLLPDHAGITLDAALDRGLRLSIPRSKHSYTMRVTSGQDSPELPELPAKVLRSYRCEDVLHRLFGATYAVSNDFSRPHLSSALFCLGPKELSVVCTDGHRLAMAGLVLEKPEEILIAGTALPALHAILGDALPDDEVAISQGRGAIFFTLGCYTLSTSKVDARFPPYQKVIPTVTNRVTASVDELVRACRAMGVVANVIDLQVEGGQIYFTASNSDEGDGTDSIACEPITASAAVRLAVYYFQEALQHAATTKDGKVELGFGDHLHDGVRVDGKETVAVIMQHG